MPRFPRRLRQRAARPTQCRAPKMSSARPDCGVDCREFDPVSPHPTLTGDPEFRHLRDMAEATKEPVPRAFCRTALRRAIAVLSALAFLTVAFSHLAQHDGLVGSAETTWQSAAVPSDD